MAANNHTCLVFSTWITPIDLFHTTASQFTAAVVPTFLERKGIGCSMTKAKSEAESPDWHRAQIEACLERLKSPSLSEEGLELWEGYLLHHQQRLKQLEGR